MALSSSILYINFQRLSLTVDPIIDYLKIRDRALLRGQSWALTVWLALEFELNDYHWHETYVSFNSIGTFRFQRDDSVNIDKTGACWSWNKRHNIQGCEIEEDTSAKNSMYYGNSVFVNS